MYERNFSCTAASSPNMYVISRRMCTVYVNIYPIRLLLVSFSHFCKNNNKPTRLCSGTPAFFIMATRRTKTASGSSHGDTRKKARKDDCNEIKLTIKDQATITDVEEQAEHVVEPPVVADHVVVTFGRNGSVVYIVIPTRALFGIRHKQFKVQKFTDISLSDGGFSLRNALYASFTPDNATETPESICDKLAATVLSKLQAIYTHQYFTEYYFYEITAAFNAEGEDEEHTWYLPLTDDWEDAVDTNEQYKEIQDHHIVAFMNIHAHES